MGDLSSSGSVPGSVNESHRSFPGQEAVGTCGGRQAGGRSPWGRPRAGPAAPLSLPSSSLHMAFGASARCPSLEWLVTQVTRQQSPALGTVALLLWSHLCCHCVCSWAFPCVSAVLPSLPRTLGPEGKNSAILQVSRRAHSVPDSARWALPPACYDLGGVGGCRFSSRSSVSSFVPQGLQDPCRGADVRTGSAHPGTAPAPP